MWKAMDKDRRREVALAFLGSVSDKSERKAVTGLIAAKLKFRPQFAAKLPDDKAAGYLAGLLDIDELMAGTILRAYLFGAKLPMLAMFLDSLGIDHDKGAIKADNVPPPTKEALEAAMEKLRAAFPTADVELYKEALLTSDPETWVNLE